MGRSKIPELRGASKLLIETCADMVGPNARTVKELAKRYRRKPITIYVRRLRLEKKLGKKLPRPFRQAPVAA